MTEGISKIITSSASEKGKTEVISARTNLNANDTDDEYLSAKSAETTHDKSITAVTAVTPSTA